MVDVSTVPDRLKQGVGKTEGKDVLHRFLAQEMIDAVDLGFDKHAGQKLVEGPG